MSTDTEFFNQAVYTKPGTSTGFELDAGAWSLIHTQSDSLIDGDTHTTDFPDYTLTGLQGFGLQTDPDEDLPTSVADFQWTVTDGDLTIQAGLAIQNNIFGDVVAGESAITMCFDYSLVANGGGGGK